MRHLGSYMGGARRDQKSLESELQVMCSLAPQDNIVVLGWRGNERRCIERQMPDCVPLLGLRKWAGCGIESWQVTGKFPAGAWCGLNYICRCSPCSVVCGNCIR